MLSKGEINNRDKDMDIRGDVSDLRGLVQRVSFMAPGY